MNTSESSRIRDCDEPEFSTRPKRIIDVPDDQALALFDLDGTLTKPGSELIIQRFIEEVQIGAMHTRLELLNRFQEWSDARRGGRKPNYQSYLTDVGNLWARMLVRGGYSPTRPELMQVTENWFENKGKKEIMDYSDEALNAVRGRLIRPIMITGAPFEIAFHFAKYLGIEYAFGMEAETDSHEKYTGMIKHNTGLARTKGKICERLQNNRHKILFAMGDTHADIELMRAAIELNGRHDGRGRAVMINPRPETIEGLEDWCSGYLANDRIMVIEQHKARESVIERICQQLDRALKESEMPDGQIDRVA